jgi:hypothetical protein
VLAGTSTDPRLEWIAAHCIRLGNANAALHNYYCGGAPAAIAPPRATPARQPLAH